MLSMVFPISAEPRAQVSFSHSAGNHTLTVLVVHCFHLLSYSSAAQIRRLVSLQGRIDHCRAFACGESFVSKLAGKTVNSNQVALAQATWVVSE